MLRGDKDVKMGKKKKRLLQCDGRTDCQTARGDERKMKSPWDGRGGEGRR